MHARAAGSAVTGRAFFVLLVLLPLSRSSTMKQSSSYNGFGGKLRVTALRSRDRRLKPADSISGERYGFYSGPLNNKAWSGSLSGSVASYCPPNNWSATFNVKAVRIVY